MKSETFTFKTKDNENIFTYKWLPDNEKDIKAIVQLAHGMAEHGKRYERFAEALNSSGYGVYINDHRVFDCEGPKYAYYFHRVTLDDTSVLKQGINIVKTGKTPLHEGQMVHGMEVNWPGIMVLIRYREE